MARARVRLVCKKCGKTFTAQKKECNNRRDADSWVEWAEENITLCPDCENQKYKEFKDNEAKEKGLHIVKMSYFVYKNHFADCTKSPHSYNQDEKTIDVYLDDNQLEQYKELEK